MNIRFLSPLSGHMRMFFFISLAVLIFLPGVICAESVPEMKRHFEEGIESWLDYRMF